MKRSATLRFAEASGIVFSLIVISSTGADAYIDPGTGSYVLQVVIASLLAAGFVIRATWKNIVGAVTKRFGKRNADEQ